MDGLVLVERRGLSVEFVPELQLVVGREVVVVVRGVRGGNRDICYDPHRTLLMAVK